MNKYRNDKKKRTLLTNKYRNDKKKGTLLTSKSKYQL